MRSWAVDVDNRLASWQLEELKQLMNTFSKTDQLDTEVDPCSAKLTNCSSPTDPSSQDAGKLLFFLLRCVKGHMLTGAPPPGPKIRGLTKAMTG